MAKAEKQDSIYYERLGRYHDELRWLYMELYDNSSMFAELCDNLLRFYKERDEELKERDRERERHSDWYKQNDLLFPLYSPGGAGLGADRADFGQSQCVRQNFQQPGSAGKNQEI